MSSKGRPRKDEAERMVTICTRVPPVTKAEIILLMQRRSTTFGDELRRIIELGLSIDRQLTARGRAANI